MRKTPKNRLSIILISSLFILVGLFIIITSFNNNIVFFYSPSEINYNKVQNKIFRIGGLVKSIHKHEGGKIEFIITDNKKEMKIIYKGILPNLFRENQGIIALGKLKNRELFEASELLVKHDENYMPREVYESLRKKAS